MEKKYTVEIRDSNKVILFRSKQVRTPVTMDISEKELPLLKATLRLGAVNDYRIKPFEERKPEDETNEEFNIDEEKEVIIEELVDDEEPKTILEKLIKENN